MCEKEIYNNANKYVQKQEEGQELIDFMITVDHIRTALKNYRIPKMRNPNPDFDWNEYLNEFFEDIKFITEEQKYTSIDHIEIDMIETILAISYREVGHDFYDDLIDFENELRKEYNHYEVLKEKYYKYRDFILMQRIIN